MARSGGGGLSRKAVAARIGWNILGISIWVLYFRIGVGVNIEFSWRVVYTSEDLISDFNLCDLGERRIDKTNGESYFSKKKMSIKYEKNKNTLLFYLNETELLNTREK